MYGRGRHERKADAMLGSFAESDSEEDKGHGDDYGDSAGRASSRQSVDISGGGHAHSGRRVNPYLAHAHAGDDSSGEDVADQFDVHDDAGHDTYAGSDEDDEDFSGHLRGLGARSRSGKSGYDMAFPREGGGGDGAGRGRGRGGRGGGGRGSAPKLTGPVSFVASSAAAAPEKEPVEEQEQQQEKKFRSLLGQAGAGAGAGAGARFGGIGSNAGLGVIGSREASTAFTTFTTTAAAPAAAASIVHTDKVTMESMGSWQKHTKGFGLKYLQKFEFKGRLGKEESGIAQPVEAVAHDGLRGLGFGSKPAAATSKAKTAQQQDKEDSLDYIGERTGTRGSAGAAAAMVKAWKKSSKGGAAKAAGGAGAGQAISVEDLLKNMRDRPAPAAGSSSLNGGVLDMRGPSAAAGTIPTGPAGMGEGGPSLGQELLYNLNLAYSSLETQVYSDSRRLATLEVHVSNLQEEVKVVTAATERDALRVHRLQSLHEALVRIRNKLESDAASVTLPAAVGAVIMLHKAYPQEVVLFGLVQLLSMLASSTLHSMTTQWDPLTDPHLLREICAEWEPLISHLDLKSEPALSSECRHTLKTLLQHYAMPRIRRCLYSDWQVQSPDAAVLLIKDVRSLISESTSEQLLEQCVLPRLSAAVEEWDPVPHLNTANMNSHLFIHTWILPWLPSLADRLSVLFPDIRRKITKVIAAAANASESGGIASSASFAADLSAVRRMVEPWLSVFDKTATDRMLVRAVVPTLIWDLRQAVRAENTSVMSVISSQFLGAVSAVTVWGRVLPAEHIAAILLGEKVHTTWLARLCSFMRVDETEASVGSTHSNTATGKALKEGYLAMKHVYTDVVLQADNISRVALRVGLDLIDRWARGPAPVAGELSLLLEQSPFGISKTYQFTYFSVMPHIAGVGGGASVGKHDGTKVFRNRGIAPQVTFREVVEQRALELGWEMLPCTSSSSGGATWDGHQLFTLGPWCPVYMHQGVLFVSTGGAMGSTGQYWKPTSLEALSQS